MSLEILSPYKVVTVLGACLKSFKFVMVLTHGQRYIPIALRI